jgi:hypothetical protein
MDERIADASAVADAKARPYQQKCVKHPPPLRSFFTPPWESLEQAGKNLENIAHIANTPGCPEMLADQATLPFEVMGRVFTSPDPKP